MSGGGGVKEGTKSKELAKVSREQWEHYKKNWAPVEMQLINEFNNSDETLANDLSTSDSEIQDSFGMSDQATSITMSRYGGMTAEQSKERKRIGAVQKSLGIAEGRTSTRLYSERRKNATEEHLLGLGRSTANSATSTLGSAASMEANRLAANADSGGSGVGAIAGGVVGGVAGFYAGGPGGAMAGYSAGSAIGSQI